MEQDKEWEGTRVVWGIAEHDVRMEFTLKALYERLQGLLGDLVLVHGSVLETTAGVS